MLFFFFLPLLTFEALNPSISSMIRCKSSLFGSLSSCSVRLSSITCPPLVVNGNVVFSESWTSLVSVCFDKLLTNIRELWLSSLLSPFLFTYKGKLLFMNAHKRGILLAGWEKKANLMGRTGCGAFLGTVCSTGRRAVWSGAGGEVVFDRRGGTVARLGRQVRWGLGEYCGSVTAVLARADRQTFFVWGGSAVVVNTVQLFAEVVKGETDNVEEVSVDVFHQHASESLNTVSTSLIPDTRRYKYFIEGGHIMLLGFPLYLIFHVAFWCMWMPSYKALRSQQG